MPREARPHRSCVPRASPTPLRCSYSSKSPTNCRFVFHGDFDWGGVRIVNHLGRKLRERITRWRLERDDYLRALDRLDAI
ncbi:MAG: DUF2399 domain-containing protein [Actinomycetota bacterium]